MKIKGTNKITEKLDIFVFLMEGQKFYNNFDLKNSEGKLIEEKINEKNFLGKEGEVKILFLEDLKINIFLIGLGKSENLTLEKFKKILMNNLQKNINKFYIFFDPKILRIDEENCFSVALLNLSTMDYKYQEFLKEKTEEMLAYVYKPLRFSEKKFDEIIKKTNAIKRGIFLSRDIGNAPASFFETKNFLKTVKNLANKYNWKVNSFDEKKLKSLKLPGICTVGRASHNPPLLIEIKCSENCKKILIGKGVIFDSGGLSIKTAEGMENMKYDKCGAGVVLGTLLALSILNKSKDVCLYIPFVENLLSEKCYKPGDILVYPNGETVEVLSTDAEGRLILADAILLASKQKPSFIITVATLTGAMKYSLGSYAAGLFTKNKELENLLLQSSFKTGDFLWQFPLWEEYEDLIKGEFSTLKNSSGGVAGSITAGLFLNHFTNFPFAHIDIAQVAYKIDKNQRGATGFGVSLLVDLILNDFNRK